MAEEMVKVWVWVQTDKIGSRCVEEIEVTAEEAADEKTLERICREVAFERMEWSFSLEPVSENE